jgi:hypothetical protein
MTSAYGLLSVVSSAEQIQCPVLTASPCYLTGSGVPGSAQIRQLSGDL